jgi:hypothetical protein
MTSTKESKQYQSLNIPLNLQGTIQHTKYMYTA